MPEQREHSIDVGDGTLFAVDTGSGAPLIMVHGWPLDHRMFEYQVDSLARDFRCIAIDRRGFGQSTAHPDLRREIDDLDRVIDALELGSVHLFGVSQGGRIALRYAATRPHRLLSLLLQGAVVDGLDIAEPESDRVPVAAYAELVSRGDLDVVKALWLAHPMMQLSDAHAKEKALLASIVASYDGSDLLAFDASQYAFDVDILASLSRSGLPVLLLTGAGETEARKAHAAAIRKSAGNCEEVIFEGCGHLPNLTAASAVNGEIREFLLELDSLSPRGASA